MRLAKDTKKILEDSGQQVVSKQQARLATMIIMPLLSVPIRRCVLEPQTMQRSACASRQTVRPKLHRVFPMILQAAMQGSEGLLRLWWSGG